MIKRNERILSMAQLSMFTAIIVILAFTPMIGYIPLGITQLNPARIEAIPAELPPIGTAIKATITATTSCHRTTRPILISKKFWSRSGACNQNGQSFNKRKILRANQHQTPELYLC